jgi:SAM-dependent methyltransferase
MPRKHAREGCIELRWTGKRPVRVIDDAELVLAERNGAMSGAWTNKLIHADNLHAVSALLRGDRAAEIARAGGVKLVYFDPPFGVGADFELDRAAWTGAPGLAYRDRWDGAGHLQWLYERVVLAHALLADDGVVYVHVDWRASAHCKLVLDEIFGADKFRGWIVWRIGCGAKSRSRWSQEHQDILCYAKGAEMTFRTTAPAMREPFAATSRQMHFTRLDEKGRRYRSRVVNGKEYRYFEAHGRAVGSVWTDCPSMSANSPILAESVGWPTQKPEKLLERILEASSAPGDLVADLCAGSGTTAAIAEKLGRRWIACDVSARAVHTARKRLLRVRAELESRGRAPAAFDVLRAPDARAPVVHSSIDARIEGDRVVLDRFRVDGTEVAIDAWGIVCDPTPDSPIEWQWLRARGDASPVTSSQVLPAHAKNVLVRVVDDSAREGETILRRESAPSARTRRARPRGSPSGGLPRASASRTRARGSRS